MAMLIISLRIAIYLFSYYTLTYLIIFSYCIVSDWYIKIFHVELQNLSLVVMS